MYKHRWIGLAVIVLLTGCLSNEQQKTREPAQAVIKAGRTVVYPREDVYRLNDKVKRERPWGAAPNPAGDSSPDPF